MGFDETISEVSVLHLRCELLYLSVLGFEPAIGVSLSILPPFKELRCDGCYCCRRDEDVGRNS